jgi:hypothetical protein
MYESNALGLWSPCASTRSILSKQLLTISARNTLSHRSCNWFELEEIHTEARRRGATRGIDLITKGPVHLATSPNGECADGRDRRFGFD